MIYRLLQPISRLNPNFKKSYFSKMGSKTALILLAEGNEEMEAVIPTDCLRRAGVNTVL